MSYSYFTNQTATAADRNNNFVWIRAGDLLPLGGRGSLNPTTSVYDLGSAQKTWRNLYATNINCTNIIVGSSSSNPIPHLVYATGASLLSPASVPVAGYIDSTPFYRRIYSQVVPAPTANVIFTHSIANTNLDKIIRSSSWMESEATVTTMGYIHTTDNFIGTTTAIVRGDITTTSGTTTVYLTLDYIL